MLTGRGSYRHYVEFDVPTQNLRQIGGIKGTVGIGRYQQYVPYEVNLANANPVFGELGVNYGQRVFLTAGALGLGYFVWRALR